MSIEGKHTVTQSPIHLKEVKLGFAYKESEQPGELRNDIVTAHKDVPGIICGADMGPNRGKKLRNFDKTKHLTHPAAHAAVVTTSRRYLVRTSYYNWNQAIYTPQHYKCWHHILLESGNLYTSTLQVLEEIYKIYIK